MSWFKILTVCKSVQLWRSQIIMSNNPYKTREGGATVTVFVPYDCQNNCPFCVNKEEYKDMSDFSLEKICESIDLLAWEK